jgi:hypothetical protein
MLPEIDVETSTACNFGSTNCLSHLLAPERLATATTA